MLVLVKFYYTNLKERAGYCNKLAVEKETLNLNNLLPNLITKLSWTAGTQLFLDVHLNILLPIILIHYKPTC